jgi:catechol 2,3-dioxygenase-like lactoylglutathione lyase family enzyme
MILGVDNIGIGVSNPARSVDFYQRLGFAKAFENERGCTMIAGSVKLFLFEGALGHEPVDRQAFDLNLNPVGIDHISFLVDNVDSMHHELLARGIPFHSQPADQSWGARCAVLRDPDGTNIYLLSWLGK